jgi:membrane protein implicated in regulation of membrane protease activity
MHKRAKRVLIIAVLIGALALVSGGYCFWLMTVPLSYDWVPVVVVGFVVATGAFVISLITSLIVLIQLRRSSHSSNAPQIKPTI